ncbi:hypothetical protein KR044_003023, partial [Drosophila immigrans]
INMNRLMQLHWLLDLLCVVSMLHAIEFSSSAYCESGPCYTFNLACDNPGNVKQCHKAVGLLNERDYRNAIDDILNRLRHNVAGGLHRNLPTAARMGRMQWNNELAYLARLDVMRCKITPRPCLSSPNFSQIGHLAGMAKFPHYRGNSSDQEEMNAIKGLVQDWYWEIRSLTRFDTLRLQVSDKE